MSKKNKYPVSADLIYEEAPAVEPASFIGLDKPVKQLLEKTATRNNVSEQCLIELAVEAMIGSLKKYGYQCSKSNSEKRQATIGEGDCKIKVEPKILEQLHDVGVYFGVRVKDLLQDAIMAQRWNWQRLQPVNARSMSSIRLHMFQLEQLGPNR